MSENKLILGETHSYSLDTHETGLNNSVLVVGGPGTGKTRGIIEPNLKQAIGSYVVVDPKGNLFQKYKEHLEKHGYRVKKLNFANPDDLETARYNFFRYIHSEQDILELAHILVYARGSNVTYSDDRFWGECSTLLLSSLLAYLYKNANTTEKNLHSILSLLVAADINESNSSEDSALDYLFHDLKIREPNDFAVRTYNLFRLGAGKTLKSVLITLASKLGIFDTIAIQKLFKTDTLELEQIGNNKTALFVVVSDTDRSLDPMIEVFFSQLVSVLCHTADRSPENRLPVPVRLIFDDFMTNCFLSSMPKMLASLRSREISCMLALQAESQLYSAYGHDARTIIGCCDTYVYLGGQDLETARALAVRTGDDLADILYMPVGTMYILRRGEHPQKDILKVIDD